MATMTAAWRHYALTTLAVMVVFPAGSPAQPPRVRDSAAVRIVENAARVSAPVVFALAPTPISDIGGLKDNPDDELDPHFFSFKVLRLSNGTRVIGDRTRLRYFDPSGKQFKVAGREGQGPGEFSIISSMCRTRGDTIVVGDPANGRVSTWSHTGEFVRVASVGPAERMGCFADGTILVGSWEERQLRLEHRRLDGTIIRTLGTFGGGVPSTGYFTSQTSIAVHGTRFYIGDPRASEVRVYDQQGTLVTIVRTADAIAKVTAAEAEAMQSPGSRGSSSGGGVTTVNPRPAPPKPTEWPAYGEIRVDEGGRLWIGDFRKTQGDAYAWTAFDANGRMLGKFSSPAQLKIGDPFVLMFTDGGALVRRADDDGATHLVEYSLIQRR